MNKNYCIFREAFRNLWRSSLFWVFFGDLQPIFKTLLKWGGKNIWNQEMHPWRQNLNFLVKFWSYIKLLVPLESLPCESALTFHKKGSRGLQSQRWIFKKKCKNRYCQNTYLKNFIFEIHFFFIVRIPCFDL